MDVYEAITARYSVRAYDDRAIPDDVLERVLNAGRIAPSASNKQEWAFVVVRDADLRRRLGEAAEQPFVGQAPAVIMGLSTNPGRIMSCKVPAGPVDCAIAMDHMTLAAVQEGLGTCWIGHYDQDACREIIGAPDSTKIIQLLPIGYPAAGTGPKAKSRKSMEEVIRYDRFS